MQRFTLLTYSELISVEKPVFELSKEEYIELGTDILESFLVCEVIYEEDNKWKNT